MSRQNSRNKHENRRLLAPDEKGEYEKEDLYEKGSALCMSLLYRLVVTEVWRNSKESVKGI